VRVQALVAARVLIEAQFLTSCAALIEGGRIAALVPESEIPEGAARLDLGGGLLAPGFVDLQVNGGGGVLFNDAPSVETLAAIARAHRRFGTTGLLPTLITTDAATMARAIAAVGEAIRAGIPGVLGIHLEGPHLAPARAGVHDPRHMRPLDEAGVELLCSLGVGRTLVTLAPEQAPPARIRELTRRGVVVSLGHTDAGFTQLSEALAAGASGFTHLYNAMSQLGPREPGAVGTALADPDAWCGVIADGHHIHPASLRLAWQAKRRGKLFLVSDAMPPAGARIDHFMLDGRRIEVADGRCTTAGGRLAGSALDMAGAVRHAVQDVGIPLAEALCMASTWPAAFLGISHQRGRIAPGLAADLVLLDDDLRVRASWIGGQIERAGERQR
jgi:N-acetylglucosamine-6-phosphate deacetylase